MITSERYQNVTDPRLGRHFSWDTRNSDYLFHGTPTYTSVKHQSYIAVLDQGNLGSCTGNAAVGALGRAQLFLSLSVAQQGTLGEPLAVQVYSDATVIDPFDGTYPPDDTGSNGASVAKVCQTRKLITSYLHATTFTDTLAALEKQPIITGVNWYNNFFYPDANGLITISKNDYVAGGHEFVLDEINAEKQLIGFTNSWSPDWGIDGRAFMSFATYQRLLNEQGDATIFTPLSAPPSPDTNADDIAFAKVSGPWATQWQCTRYDLIPLQKAIWAWIKAKGLDAYFTGPYKPTV